MYLPQPPQKKTTTKNNKNKQQNITLTQTLNPTPKHTSKYIYSKTNKQINETTDNSCNVAKIQERNADYKLFTCLLRK